MKVLSLNIRKLGAIPKKLALKRLLAITRPTVLLLQETMIEGGRSKDTLKTHMRDWDMETLDAEGHSRGLLIA